MLRTRAMYLQGAKLMAVVPLCLIAFSVGLGVAQEPSSTASPGAYVPIALPTEAPSGWVPETWTNFRRRCQEVADMSAGNLPMGSGDYGYAAACTKQGAYFHPVEQRPPIPLVATPTPGPNGHMPLSIPLSPPLGSGWSPDLWARQRAQCQQLADNSPDLPTAHSFELAELCSSLSAMGLSPSPIGSPPESQPSSTGSSVPTPIPTPSFQSEVSPSIELLSPNTAVGPFGTQFAGGGRDVCNTGQPFDVAARAVLSGAGWGANRGDRGAGFCATVHGTEPCDRRRSAVSGE
jgi:hypothetical protein